MKVTQIVVARDGSCALYAVDDQFMLAESIGNDTLTNLEQPPPAAEWHALVELSSRLLRAIEHKFVGKKTQSLVGRIVQARRDFFTDDLVPMIAPASWLPTFGKEANKKQWDAWERLSEEFADRFSEDGLTLASSATPSGVGIPRTRALLRSSGDGKYVVCDARSPTKPARFKELELVAFACAVLSDSQTLQDCEDQFSPFLAVALEESRSSTRSRGPVERRIEGIESESGKNQTDSGIWSVRTRKRRPGYRLEP